MTRQPVRLPRRRPQLVGRALGAALALVALLGGMPYALICCSGPLDLTHVPTWGELSAELSSGASTFTLMRMLITGGWALWLLICSQTLYELAWCVVRLPQLLQASPDQRPQVLRARRTFTGGLVISIAIGVLALARPMPAPTGAFPATFTTASVVATASSAPTVDALPAENVAVPTCEVHHGDTLWDLAQRHLGSPLRWKEIYQLNTGRVQGDGSRLTDPDIIRPGWIFLLPEAGVASPQPTGPAPAEPTASHNPQSQAQAQVPAAPPAPPAPSNHPASGAPVPGPKPSTAAPTTKPTPTNSPVPTRVAAPALQLPTSAGYLALSVGVTLSAAAVARTVFRRRTYRPGSSHSPHEPRERIRRTPPSRPRFVASAGSTQPARWWNLPTTCRSELRGRCNSVSSNYSPVTRTGCSLLAAPELPTRPGRCSPLRSPIRRSSN